jgi:hypothetical protein
VYLDILPNGLAAITGYGRSVLIKQFGIGALLTINLQVIICSDASIFQIILSAQFKLAISQFFSQ